MSRHVATQDQQRTTALDIVSLHIRVANFHVTGLKTSFGRGGAVVLDDPGLLEPSLQEDELLHDNSDHVYKRECLKASALSFHSQI